MKDWTVKEDLIIIAAVQEHQCNSTTVTCILDNLGYDRTIRDVEERAEVLREYKNLSNLHPTFNDADLQESVEKTNQQIMEEVDSRVWDDNDYIV